MRPSSIDDSVKRLVAAFPVEDVWFLETAKAPECELERPFHLIVAVPDNMEAHLLEPGMRDAVLDADVHVFPHSAFDRIPRPLLVKMALTHGESVHRG